MSTKTFAIRPSPRPDQSKFSKPLKIVMPVASLSPRLGRLETMRSIGEGSPRVRPLLPPMPLTTRASPLQEAIHRKILSTHRLIQDNKENYEEFSGKNSPTWQIKSKDWKLLARSSKKSVLNVKPFLKPPSPGISNIKLPNGLPRIDFSDCLFVFEDAVSKKHTSISLDSLIDKFCDLYNEFAIVAAGGESEKLATFQRMVAVEEFPHKEVLMDLVLDRLGNLKPRVNPRMISHEATRIVFDYMLVNQSIGSIRLTDRRRQKMMSTQLTPKQSQLYRIQNFGKKSEYPVAGTRRRAVSDRRLPPDFDYKPLLANPPFIALIQSLYRVVDVLLDQRCAVTMDRLRKGFQELEAMNHWKQRLLHPGVQGSENSPKKKQIQAAFRCQGKFPELRPGLLEADRPRLRFYAHHAFETESISLQKFFKNVQKFDSGAPNTSQSEWN